MNTCARCGVHNPHDGGRCLSCGSTLTRVGLSAATLLLGLTLGCERDPAPAPAPLYGPPLTLQDPEELPTLDAPPADAPPADAKPAPARQTRPGPEPPPDLAAPAPLYGVPIDEPLSE